MLTISPLFGIRPAIDECQRKFGIPASDRQAAETEHRETQKNLTKKSITKFALAASIAAFTPHLLAQEDADPAATAEVAVGADAATAIEEGTLTTNIRDSVTFSILSKALKAAELDTVLGQKGSFTVFAPTDEAFSKLDEGVLDKLMLPANKEKLRSLLLFHVVPGNLMTTDLKEGELTTMNGEKFTVDIEGDGDIEINEAHVSSPNVRASNGIMHSVEDVLVPSSLDGFADLED